MLFRCIIALFTLLVRQLYRALFQFMDTKYERVVCRGLGMPISKEPGKFGDLKVKFDAVFPAQLSEDQKKKLKDIL